MSSFRRVNCPLRLRTDDAFSSYREDDSNWSDAWRTPAGATLSFLTFNDCEPTPEFLDGSLRRSLGPALKSDQPSQQRTEKLQVLSWNPRRARGSDPIHWPRTSTARGKLIAFKRALASSPITQWRRTSAWPPSTIARYASTRTPSRVTSPVRRFWSHVLFFVQHGLLKAWCVHRTLASPRSVHQARRRHSYWRFQQGRERQISPLEAAFSHANIPWPTSGVTRLWGPGSEPQGHKWPDCCGFMVLPESQSQWLILRHGSINVVPPDIGLRATEKTCHYEQWLHLKFAGRKRRRDSMSRQKIVLHTNK